ncbi:uncharacterized protein LOC119066481 isoform X2 [Bradysia coprophila]|uniref:uncharacterized protein LOC119066481 isoform X2 n=1 Tax=Bradysia coprophila TaxID=38358 RepID=UPI00187D987D|nr:uncharacterized protein LOC119066481 isoform X2 [Bradysia coprophila]
MAVMQSIVFASAVILVLLVNEGSAIRCYECNSYNDTRCAQDIPPTDLSIECGDHQKGVKYSFCRKIKQIIEFSVNQLPADTRIIRGCGWDDSSYKNKCYQRSGFGGRQEVCACDQDNCNDSTSLKSSLAGVLALSVLMLVAMKN